MIVPVGMGWLFKGVIGGVDVEGEEDPHPGIKRDTAAAIPVCKDLRRVRSRPCDRLIVASSSPDFFIWGLYSFGD